MSTKLKNEYMTVEAVLDAIDRHWKTYSTPPTLEWLRRDLNLLSTSNVSYWIEKLRDSGLILDKAENDSRAKIVPVWVHEALRQFTTEKIDRSRFRALRTKCETAIENLEA